MNLDLGYPVYYIFAIVLLAFCYSFALYFRNKKSKHLSRVLIYLLFSLRFISVFVVSFLLLEPVVKSVSSVVEKPIVVFVQDNSESILLSKDSSFYKNDYLDSVSLFKRLIAEKYDLEVLNFGNEVTSNSSIDYTQKKTDFNALFKSIKERFLGRNLAAIVLASDGIMNSGFDPLYKDYGLDQVTLHALVLGDTNFRKDISVQKVRFNKQVKIGNKYPVEAQVLVKGYQNETIKVSLYSGDELLAQQQKVISQELEALSCMFTVESSVEGTQQLRVEAENKAEEITYKNNSYSLFVNVVNNVEKILILASAPHPDIAALKQSLNDKIGRALDVQLIADFKDSISSYDLLVLHRADNSNKRKLLKIVNESKKENIPILYFTGSELNADLYKEINPSIALGPINGSYVVSPIVNPSFSSFIISQKMGALIKSFPPLEIPFSSSYKNKVSGDVVLYQSINGVPTAYPLVQLMEYDNQRKCTFLGEGIWRWRLNEYVETGGFNEFDSFFSKIVQYLLSSNKKEKFTIDYQQEYQENEAVSISAKLFNDNYEQVNSAEVLLQLYNDSAKILEKNFRSSYSGYAVKLNELNPGKYNFEISTQLGEKMYRKKGNFIVKKMRLEFLRTNADYQFLGQLAQKYSGEVFTANELSKLAVQLNTKNDVAQIIHEQVKVQELVNWKILLFFIVLLLAVEWVVRKISGAY